MYNYVITDVSVHTLASHINLLCIGRIMLGIFHFVTFSGVLRETTSHSSADIEGNYVTVSIVFICIAGTLWLKPGGDRGHSLWLWFGRW